MNTLSWLIYLGSISGNLKETLTFLAILSVLASGAGFLMSLAWTDGSVYTKDPARQERHLAGYEKTNQNGKAILKRSIPAVVAFSLLAAIFPSQNTFYAIAASELGERVAKNEHVTELSREAMDTLKHWLKEQREPKKGKATSP